MTNKQVFSIQQRAFPFIKKILTLELETNNLKIEQISTLKSDEVDIEIERLNPLTQKIKRLSLFWLLISSVGTLYFFGCLSAWLWSPPTNTHEIAFYLIGQSLLFLGACNAWWKFFNSSYNITLFFDKYTNTIAFSLFTNKPNKENYETFIEALKKAIVNREQTRSIQSILNEIPTHILVEEFSSSYMDELSKRGIDVSALLSFLQKRALNTQDPLKPMPH